MANLASLTSREYKMGLQQYIYARAFGPKSIEYLSNLLDAQSVEATAIDQNTIRVRVLPTSKNAPRYFLVKITEQL